MISDDAAPPADGGSVGETGPLSFDVRVAHQARIYEARIYDYLLGGCFP